MTCRGCGQTKKPLDTPDHCQFPSVDRITKKAARIATPADVQPLNPGSEKHRARKHAITAANKGKTS